MNILSMLSIWKLLNYCRKTLFDHSYKFHQVYIRSWITRVEKVTSTKGLSRNNDEAQSMYQVLCKIGKNVYENA